MDTTDSRTFPEIWATLSKQEREDVTYQLMKDKCTLVRQTVWNWATGKTQPTNAIVKNAIATSVKKATGINVIGNCLFPVR